MVTVVADGDSVVGAVKKAVDVADIARVDELSKMNQSIQTEQIQFGLFLPYHFTKSARIGSGEISFGDGVLLAGGARWKQFL